MKLKDVVKTIQKSTGAESLNESSYAEVKDFLDIVCYIFLVIL